MRLTSDSEDWIIESRSAGSRVWAYCNNQRWIWSCPLSTAALEPLADLTDEAGGFACNPVNFVTLRFDVIYCRAWETISQTKIALARPFSFRHVHLQNNPKTRPLELFNVVDDGKYWQVHADNHRTDNAADENHHDWFEHGGKGFHRIFHFFVVKVGDLGKHVV